MGLGKYLCCCTSILSYALVICILYFTITGPTNTNDLDYNLTNKTLNETLLETFNETILFALNETIAQNEFNSSLLNSTDNE